MKLREARAIAHALVAEWLRTPPDSVCVAEGNLTAHQTLLSDRIAEELLKVKRETYLSAAKAAGRRPKKRGGRPLEIFDAKTAKLIASELRGLAEGVG